MLPHLVASDPSLKNHDCWLLHFSLLQQKRGNQKCHPTVLHLRTHRWYTGTPLSSPLTSLPSQKQLFPSPGCKGGDQSPREGRVHAPHETAQQWEGWRDEERWIEMNGLIGSWVEKLHALMLLNMTEENLRGVILVPAFRPQLSMVQGALRSSSPFMCWSIQEKASGFNQTSLTRLISQCFSKIVSEHESVLMVHLSEIWDEVSHDASTERFAAKPEPAARR